MFRALIVEDHAELRKSHSHILSFRFPSLAFAEAATGKIALQQINDIERDPVFMGISLPDGNGLRLTKAIKALHSNSTLAVITVYNQQKYR